MYIYQEQVYENVFIVYTLVLQLYLLLLVNNVIFLSVKKQ